MSDSQKCSDGLQMAAGGNKQRATYQEVTMQLFNLLYCVKIPVSLNIHEIIIFVLVICDNIK